MQRYEFKVIPAPRRGEKQRGVKTTEDRFALALTTLMNEQAAAGWDYLRADTLPCEERAGLTGSKTTYQNMLIFRREIRAAAPVLHSGQAAHQLFPEASEAAAGEASGVSGGGEPSLTAAKTAAPVADPSLRLGAATAPEGATPSLGPAKGDATGE